MVRLPKRARKDKGFHAGHAGVAGARHSLERSTSEKHCVELLEERVEIDFRIHDDPVRFAVGSSDIPIKTCCYCVTNASHKASWRTFELTRARNLIVRDDLNRQTCVAASPKKGGRQYEWKLKDRRVPAGSFPTGAHCNERPEREEDANGRHAMTSTASETTRQD
jgi:hypothetical protein